MFLKKSLKVKLSFMLVCLVLLVFILTIALSNIFLNRYYLHDKNHTLISSFEKINEIYVDGLEAGESYSTDSGQTFIFSGDRLSKDLSFRLDRLSQNSNLAILIYRDIDRFALDYFVKGNTKLLIYSSLGMSENSKVENNNIYGDYITSIQTGSNSVSAENYEIHQVDVARLSSSYIYLGGILENGDHILIRASVAGIMESVALSNKFFAYVTLIAMVIGFIVMYAVTSYFLQPITALTEIAKRMSKFDFTAKYDVKTEDEVGILGNSMNVLSETLEEALVDLKAANTELQRDLEKKDEIDAMRKEFLSNVSHELKTPIALIQGYAEGLQDNINDDEESRQFYCEVIVDEAQKMNQMVKKIMALNQLEFGYNKINMEHFDIVSMIRAVIAKSDILLKQKEAVLRFECKNPVYVWSDAYMAEEIFTNYFSNALNHLDGERHIDIDVIQKENTVRISVFNNGDQIPQDDLSNIWDKFYKVDKARTREYGGSGVGLSIVRASMEQLGQLYGVINHEDGVEFWYELDCRNVPDEVYKD